MQNADPQIRLALSIAVQDATDALRNSTMIATAASAAGLARFFATNDRIYLEAAKEGQHLITKAIETLRMVVAISQDYVGEDHPSGSDAAAPKVSTTYD